MKSRLQCLVPCLLIACFGSARAALPAPSPLPTPVLAPVHGDAVPVVLTLFGEQVLLFMEYPQLVAGEPARFLAHFSVLATGEPVRTGAVALQIGPTTLRADAPARDGLFIPEGSAAEAGTWPASITVTSAQATETIPLPDVTVHASSGAAHAASDAAAAAATDHEAAIPFLLEQQWKVGLLLARSEPRTLTRRLSVPARVRLAEGASAIVSAPASGRLLALDDGRLPLSGTAVSAGQELALIEPPLSASDATALATLSLEWDLKSLEIERTLAEASTRLEFAGVELERLERLQPDGLATRQQLVQGERDVALARASLDAAHSARETLDAIRARRAARGDLAQGAVRHRMRAPISGIVSSEGRVLGEWLEAGTPLLRIVDGSQLWVEGHIPEFHLDELSAAPRAIASFPALPELRIPVGDASSPLLQLGPEIDDHSRALPVRYVLPTPDDPLAANLHPGMLADLELALDTVDAAVTIPTEAILTERGMPTVYVMLDGEHFERRELQLGQVDGPRVEVLGGLAAGEHVATRGAATVRMAAMQPAAFGHGHEH